MENYYSVNEVADMLDVTTRSIRNYIKSGKLTGLKIGGKWYFSTDNILDFIAGHQLVFFMDKNDSAINKLPYTLRFNLYFEHVSSIQTFKDNILDYHQDVYANDQDRLFYYQIYKEKHAELLLSGSFDYVINFGKWINHLLQQQTDIYEVTYTDD
ncbi:MULTISPECIES: helix-turn-helix domain-containing protein [Enterococcus]|uniref:MerR family transcriptional regulator n=1 Tax=Enterococcus mundtii TaxID=53346 RepID=A0ABQ0VF08_ENTMU|nr:MULTISPECIES: helix-turn-helix domain-containing protein [Enterococcus]MZU11747.1 helix-turn-helix domain-containing protein [Bifidobacterium longum]GEN19311.1 MerR family transcriptional regulator [Ligilactobacillus acidipiscis]AUB54042.1 hypothetical protein EM4838_14140 [Enterococcus mundtii]MDB7088524.1 helix-turn-helix domain-containing protein [Enterococcus mundtii]MZZ59567.1 helix-turn-helix domain-containing protein [Enterococcus mundtii]